MKYYKYCLFSLILLTGCAKIVAPPGGPEDKTAPGIAASFPASGSINVPPDNLIIIMFSEKIVRPENDRAIFISPRPDSTPRISWKSDRVIIGLVQPFDSNKTYIISFSSDIKDRRNNQIDSSAFIAFTTGSKIDAGVIDGYIVSEDKSIKSYLVGLYEQDVFSLGSQSIDSLYPTYLTQVNKNGYFNFKFIPNGDYSLIAFEDRNRDERFTPGSEPFALPDRAVLVDEVRPLVNLILPVNFEDSSALSIDKVSVSSDGIFNIRFNQKILLSDVLDSVSSIELSSSNQTIKALKILESEELMSESILFYAGELNDSIYSLKITNPISAITEALTFDSIIILGKDDNNPPRLLEMTHEDWSQTFLDDLKVRFSFSEPIDTSVFNNESYNMIDSDSQLVKLDYQFADLFTLEFSAIDLSEGGRYRLQLAANDIRDLAGNNWGDSLREYNYSMYHPDSLGILKGEIVNNYNPDLAGPYHLEFTKVKSKRLFDIITSKNQFNLSLPEGKYIVSGYIDLNHDGYKTAGSYKNKLFAEPTAIGVDTIDVRARFETSGITIKFE